MISLNNFSNMESSIVKMALCENTQVFKMVSYRYSSFEIKVKEKFERYLRFDRDHNRIKIFVFSFPAKLFVLRLLHQ